MHEQTTIDGGTVPHPPADVGQDRPEDRALPRYSALGPYPTRGSAIESVQAELRRELRKGTRCRCCGQHAQIYRRKLNATMIEALHLLHDHGNRGGAFTHAQTLFRERGTGNKFGGDVGKLALWRLVEEEDKVRDDGGRAGWWRVTPNGAGFLSGLFEVSQYALVYDGKLLGHEGEFIGIDDVAPEFRLDELRAGL